jgi:peptidoglycan/xylan/chitin deacetylase (PgdA/CDA1 family)
MKETQTSMMYNRSFAFRRILPLLLVLTILCGCTAAEPVIADAYPDSDSAFQNDSVQTEFLTEAMERTISSPDTEPVGIITESLPTETDRMSEQAEEAAPAPPDTEAVSTSVSVSRIAVPRLSGQTRETAEALLLEAGISYTVTEIYSKQYEKGTVTKLHFYGTLDEENCYINPKYPVELQISLGPRLKTNVRAVDAKRIYLTFDDGPYANTDRILEILAAYDVKATFFTVGMYVAVYPKRTKAIADSGHLLACHSYTHDYMTLYESADSVLKEIHSWESAVTKAGVTLPETIYFRFPGGSTTSYIKEDRFEDIFWAVTDAGYYAMDWTCSNNDRYLNGKTEDQTMVEYLQASTIATLGSLSWDPTLPKVMLMHDTADETVEVLPWIIEYLIGEGYTFGTLDELDGYWVFPY